MLARSVTTTPTIVTIKWVTNPAKMSVKPNARTIGQAVGAGTRIECCRCSVICLPSDHVNHRKHDHPNCVDEVPIPREKLEPAGLAVHASAKGEREAEH